MIVFIIKSTAIAFSVVTVIFTFVSEAFFNNISWISQEVLEHLGWFPGIGVNDINIVISRIICFFQVWVATMLVYAIFLTIRWSVTITGQNYSIQIEYGNILKKKNCKRVINFDECFTTQVGSRIADINPESICGQYLLANPNLNINKLIEDVNIKPERGKSKYQQKDRYAPGTIVVKGDDLLMAFARLDENGKGRFFSRDEYIVCLERLWKELENHYSEKDVCIPILGAGTTVIDSGTGASISQQDLLDMIIWSYRLSSHKIKAPHKLRIICKRNSGFSINKISKN